MMEAREVIEKTLLHLARQGRRAVDPNATLPNATCRYRWREEDGGGVLRCAVGYWIPDEEYDLSMEGKWARDPAIEAILERRGIDVELLLALQRLHDSEVTWKSRESFLAAVEGFLLGFGLTERAHDGSYVSGTWDSDVLHRVRRAVEAHHPSFAFGE